MAKGLTGARLFSTNDDKDIDEIVELMPQRVRGETLLEVPLGLIRPDPNQPRKHFTEADLDSLAQRISATGGKITKPIDLRPDPDNEGHYVIEDGQMRWTVYDTRTEHKSILSRVFTSGESVDVADLKLRQLMANIGGIDMTLLNIAEGIEEWCNLFNPPKTRKEAARAFGWNQTKMSRTLKILKAPDCIKQVTTELQITNYNTVDHMIKAHKHDENAFDEAMVAFLADGFAQNPEAYWKAVYTDQTVLDDESFRPNITSEAGTSEELDDKCAPDPKSGDGSSGDKDSTSPPIKAEKPVKKAEIITATEVEVRCDNENAVLQFSYLVGRKTLTSHFKLNSELKAKLKQLLSDD